MTIKEIKEKYRDYWKDQGGRNTFATYDFQDGNGKVVIVVKIDGNWKDVIQVIRVSDGKELLDNGRCRPCDNLEDAIDVAGEMLKD